ncbi:MAG: alpha-amylase family glycosyl hydrolase [Prevotellaceae bacterium]|nr:alpha-amylase family glycosyl hydrolase [Prevotellaceae bacterium]
MTKEKIIIYQVLPRVFGNTNPTNKESGTITENGCGKFSSFDDATLSYIHKMGFTHIWFTGVVRHASQTDYSQFGIPSCHPAVVKGKAGSPYSIVDYYDVDPDLADDINNRMAEFEALVRRVHKKGMKVVLDFVPNHVARQYHSIAKPMGVKDFGADDDSRKAFDPQNNFYYCPNDTFAPYIDLKAGAEKPYFEAPAKATGNDCFNAHPNENDWYETVKLNYGVDYINGHHQCFYPIPNTWDKMTDILEYWAAKGVDAFRCDMAEMVPVDFWHHATQKLKALYPELLFIGEVYQPDLYRNYVGWGGFDYLYDKVGVYDTLRNVVCGQSPASAITQAWQQTDDINSHMLYFLENHDEQRIASPFFAGNGNKALPALIVSLFMRNNPFMMYMGQSLGEQGNNKEGFSGNDGRTTIFDYWCMESVYRMRQGKPTTEEQNLHTIYNKVLCLAKKEKTISNGLFFDLMYVNPSSEHFNANRQFAFLRKYNNELLIVCANFDDRNAEVEIKIPEHAFDCLDIEEGTYKGRELFTKSNHTFKLKKDGNISITVPSNFASVWKITL